MRLRETQMYITLLILIIHMFHFVKYNPYFFSMTFDKNKQSCKVRVQDAGIARKLV